MAIQTKDTASRERFLAPKVLSPIYLFFGEEDFLIDDALKNIEKTVLKDGVKDFNFHSFDGSEDDPIAIRDAVETLPMMAERRLVVVKRFDAMSEKELEPLMPILERPVDTTVLVFAGNTLDKRKKPYKTILSRGTVVEFKKPYDNTLPKWVAFLAKRAEIHLENDAINILLQLVGSQLTDLAAEINKIADFARGSSKGVIDAETVAKVVSRVRLQSVFELTDAIGAKDRARALDCLADLLHQEQNEVGILALISRHFRILRRVYEAREKGMSEGEISRAVSIPPYFIKNYVNQARTWNQSALDRTLESLLETDRGLKTSPIASHVWLESFILKTCEP